MCTREKDPEGPRSLAHGSYSCRCRLGIKVFCITSTRARTTRQPRLSFYTKPWTLLARLLVTGFTSPAAEEPSNARRRVLWNRGVARAKTGRISRGLFIRTISIDAWRRLRSSLYARFARIYLLTLPERALPRSLSLSLDFRIFFPLRVVFFLFSFFVFQSSSSVGNSVFVVAETCRTCLRFTRTIASDSHPLRLFIR